MTTAAACVALYNTQGGVLLLQRNANSYDGPGCWEVLGGLIDPGEEALTAAVRECWEEVEVRIDPAQVTFAARFQGLTQTTKEPLDVQYFVAPAPVGLQPQDLVFNEGQQQARWIPLGPAPALPLLVSLSAVWDDVQAAVRQRLAV